MFKKVLLALTLTSFTSSAFAYDFNKGSKIDKAFLEKVGLVFGKPAFTSLSERKLQTKNFDYESLEKQKTDFAKKNFISNDLKLKSVGLVENKNEVLIVDSSDLVKMNHPVFNELLPNQIREQVVTVIKKIPKRLRKLNLDRQLRAHYSRVGDLKITPDKSRIVISDWTSNQRKILDIIEKL